MRNRTWAQNTKNIIRKQKYQSGLLILDKIDFKRNFLHRNVRPKEGSFTMIGVNSS